MLWHMGIWAKPQPETSTSHLGIGITAPLSVQLPANASVNAREWLKCLGCYQPHGILKEVPGFDLASPWLLWPIEEYTSR